MLQTANEPFNCRDNVEKAASNYFEPDFDSVKGIAACVEAQG
jgi:hypothetical protein